MKLKLKLDKDTLKEFFLQHAEKIVFGVVILLFLGFIYSAATREVWTKRPEELSNLAKAAVKHINDTTGDKGDRKVPAVFLDAQRQIQPVSSALLVQWPTTPIPKAPVPKIRERPEILPLEQPVAAAGNGAFNMQETLVPTQAQLPGGTVGQRWVVITGLLPLAAQRDRYVEALKATEADIRRGTTGLTGIDWPQYVFYRVERAEVVSGDEAPANLQWTPLNVAAALMKARVLWRASTPQEKVSVRYLPRYPMAFPLGPLVNGTWGPEVAHEPDIPYLTQPEMVGMMPMPDMGKQSSKKGKEKDKDKAKPPEPKLPTIDIDNVPDDPSLFSDPNSPLGGPGGPGGMYGGGYPGMSPDMMPGGYPGGYPGGMSPPMPGGFPGMPGYPAEGGMPGYGAPGMPGQTVELPKYQLFRFFDFTVQPAKKYRYRVRLMLRNPNYMVEPQWLASNAEGEAKLERLESEWSDPTEPVFVPRDARILAGPVTAPRDPVVVEPTATFLIVRFDKKTGETLHKEYPDENDKQTAKMWRGQLANFFDVPRPRPAMPAGYPPTTRPKDTINFVSDYVLLDISGGNRLGKAKLLEPSRQLWLDPDGKLLVRTDIDDEEEYKKFKEGQPKPVPGMPGYTPDYPMPYPGGHDAPGMTMPGEYPGMPPGMSPPMPGYPGMDGGPGYMPAGPGAYMPAGPGGYGPGGPGMEMYMSPYGMGAKGKGPRRKPMRPPMGP